MAIILKRAMAAIALHRKHGPKMSMGPLGAGGLNP